MKLLPSLLAAATTLALSSAAFAAPTPITLTSDGFGSMTGTFAGSVSGGSFSFTAMAGDSLDLLSLSSTYAMRSTRPTATPPTTPFSSPVQSTGFNITGVMLDGVFVGSNDPIVSAPVLSNAGKTKTVNIYDNWTFSLPSLAGGTHVIEVFGTSVAGGGFTGTLITTPVPEPETYAMMLAGLAALGFMARRRQSA